MKFRKSYLFTLGITAILSIFVAVFYLSAIGEPKDKAILFATLGMDRANLTNEVSSYEIERASEHFANVVLGWTMDPGFVSEFSSVIPDASYTGQRQEKENLIFTVEGYFDSAKPAEEFLKMLDAKLAEYAVSTGATYKIATHNETFIDGQRSDLRIVLGFLLISVICAGSLLVFKDYAVNEARN